MPTNSLPVSQLKRALQIAERIQALESQLASILGGSVAPTASSTSATPTRTGSHGRGRRGRRKGSKMSPEGRARIAAAQRARWAKAKAGK